MILHRLVDIEICAWWRIEASEQLVHHDQQLHGGGFFGEQPFGPLLVGLGLGHARLGFDIGQQVVVRDVDKLLVGLGVCACLFT